MNKTKKPRIRFKGFTDDWEQRKLGDIATFINGRAYSQTELLDEGKYRVLRVGNFYTNDSWYYSNIELPERYYANDGDLLYTWSATFGPHIWHGEKVIYHYHIWKIELANTGKKHFMVQLLDRDKEALLAGHNGSTMIHITKSGMEQKHVMIPVDATEQDKIGVFFTYLDKTITLHQRKCEKLKIIKKSMIENCFPKNGQKVPKIRFSGFTGDWEQRKVGDLCYMKGRIGWQGLKSSDFISKGPYCVTGTDFYNGKIQWEKCYHVSEARYNMDPYIQLKPGDLLITKDGTIGKLAFIDNLPGKACLNSHLLVIRPNEPAELSNIYLFQVFSSELFLAYYTQSGTGSTMKSLSQGVISNFKISLPCIDEQKKIGDYLKNVDDLITLHQRKLEKLKKIKKSMLERMFV